MRDKSKKKTSKRTALSISDAKSHIRKSSSQKSPKRKLVKILSLDGGGIRGIIPALILQEIERKLKTKEHLTQCFDLMSGTSTGGIIVLLLNTPILIECLSIMHQMWLSFIKIWDRQFLNNLGGNILALLMGGLTRNTLQRI